MDLDLRVVRYFVAVADAGTFTAAADQLHIATPSLSQQIRRLERALGVRLLDRDHRGARLTPAGEEFLGYARALLAGQERAVAAIRRRVMGARRSVRIGFLSSMAGENTRRGPRPIPCHRARSHSDRGSTYTADAFTKLCRPPGRRPWCAR